MHSMLGAITSGAGITQLQEEMKQMNKLINALAQEMRLLRLEIKRQNDRVEKS